MNTVESDNKETIKYKKYYTGSVLVKFEKDCLTNDFYVTEIKVKDGKAVLVITKNDEIIEEHELGIIDRKPLNI